VAVKLTNDAYMFLQFMQTIWFTVGLFVLAACHKILRYKT